MVGIGQFYLKKFWRLMARRTFEAPLTSKTGFSIEGPWASRLTPADENRPFAFIPDDP
ncbi:hypothetical protein AB7M47_007328 [Bradyrhizobium elkanii]